MTNWGAGMTKWGPLGGGNDELGGRNDPLGGGNNELGCGDENGGTPDGTTRAGYPPRPELGTSPSATFSPSTAGCKFTARQV